MKPYGTPFLKGFKCPLSGDIIFICIKLKSESAIGVWKLKVWADFELLTSHIASVRVDTIHRSGRQHWHATHQIIILSLIMSLLEHFKKPNGLCWTTNCKTQLYVFVVVWQNILNNIYWENHIMEMFRMMTDWHYILLT